MKERRQIFNERRELKRKTYDNTKKISGIIFNERKMMLKRGDIIWLKRSLLPNDFGGSVQSFNRPYIVISNNINNKKAPIINVACMSTQTSKSHYSMHAFIEKEKYGLEKDSVVFAEQVMTIPKSYVHTVVGHLDDEDMKRLNKAIYIQMINEKCDLSLV